MARRVFTVAIASLLAAAQTFAGGPLQLTGTAATNPGQPFVWNVTTPIHYTVDTGPLSVNPSGQTVITNAQGLTRVQNLFNNWSIPTSSIQYAYGGPITGVTGGDVKTIQDLNTVRGSCNAGTQSPVIFDANGSLIQALGLDPLVIGFTSTCKLDPVAGHILSAMIVMNGEFQDRVNNVNTMNYEISLRSVRRSPSPTRWATSAARDIRKSIWICIRMRRRVPAMWIAWRAFP